jgi:hypothetical protein
LKQKLLLLLFFFTFLNCFSQDRKTIHGKVVFNEMAIEKIHVVNLTIKKSSTTDAEGNFSIEAKAGDELFVLSNDYYDIKITLEKQDFTSEKFIISLSKKPIELDEVTINKVEKINVTVSPEEIRMAKLAKYENSPKVLGVYTGEMPYGVDFVGLFKKIFKSNKKKDKEGTSKFASFKEYAVSKFDVNEFFYKKLDINLEELDLFMAFCENDDNYKAIMQREDTLETLEFLTTKNEAFKKLER